MTKLAIKELHEVTGNFKDVDTVLVNRFELLRLQKQRDELLMALRQTAMWLPILTKMAGLDAEETQVELSDFQDDPSRPPETLTIASSMAAARTAITKAGGAA